MIEMYKQFIAYDKPNCVGISVVDFRKLRSVHLHDNATHKTNFEGKDNLLYSDTSALACATQPDDIYECI